MSIIRFCRAGFPAAAIILLLLFQGCAATTEATVCDGSSVEAWQRCGDEARADGNYAHAIADYGEALKLDPHYTPALINRGDSYDKLQNYDAALRDFTEAIRLNPRALAVYMNRSAAYFHKGDLPAAMADVRQCQEIEPTYADAHYNLAFYLMKSGRLEESLAAFADAIQLYTEAAAHPPGARVTSWFNDDPFYAHSSSVSPGRRNIDAYLAEAYYWRSRAYRELGDGTRADNDLADAKRIDPNVVTHAGDLP